MFHQIFSCFSRSPRPRRRKETENLSPAASLESRQLLTANQAPAIDFVTTNFHGVSGRNDLIVVNLTKAGTVLARIHASDPDWMDQNLKVAVTGPAAKAVQLIPDSVNGAGWYRLVELNPSLLPKGSTSRLTVTFTDTAGQTASQTLDVVIPNSAKTIVTREDPVSGTVLGTLPASFRGGRMVYQVVGGSQGFAFSPQTIEMNSRGAIIARPEKAWQDVISPKTSSPLMMPIILTGAFDYESAFINWNSYNGTDAFETTNSSAVTWGEALIAAVNPSTGKTQYLNLKIQLTNVDEVPTIWDQVVDVGLDGTGGKIWYRDPDSFLGGIPAGADQSAIGPYQLNIVSGNEQGIFSVDSLNTAFLLSSMKLSIAKPNLLNGRTSFTLHVQLTEKGKVASEAILNVSIQPTVEEVIWID